MQTTLSEPSDDELDELKGVPVAAFGFDDVEREWIFIFTDGRRMCLSAGEDAYYLISERLH